MNDINKFDLLDVRLDGPLDRDASLRKIERAGRLCTGSPLSPDIKGAARFVRGLVGKGHESVIEHVSAGFLVTCSRACSHQLVRHRLISVTQESQRHVRYGGDGSEDAEEAAAVIIGGMAFPYGEGGLNPRAYAAFETAYGAAADAYLVALEEGVSPETARYALPNAMTTRLMVTANLRQWRHMIALRTSPKADAEIRELFTRIRAILLGILPEIFS